MAKNKSKQRNPFVIPAKSRKAGEVIPRNKKRKKSKKDALKDIQKEY